MRRTLVVAVLAASALMLGSGCRSVGIGRDGLGEGGKAGLLIGGVIGLPAAVAALPITAPIAMATTSSCCHGGPWVILLAPAVPTALAGAVVGTVIGLPVAAIDALIDGDRWGSGGGDGCGSPLAPVSPAPPAPPPPAPPPPPSPPPPPPSAVDPPPRWFEASQSRSPTPPQVE